MQITATSTSTTETKQTKNTNITSKSSSAFEDKVVEAKENKTKRLIEDILFFLRTGMTKSDLEYIEQLIKRLKEEMEKSGKKDNDAIKELFDTIETEILKIKKRYSGKAIKEANNENIPKEKHIKKEGINLDILNYKERLENIKKDLKEMKNGQEKQKKISVENNNKIVGNQSKDELQLIQDFKRLTS